MFERQLINPTKLLDLFLQIEPYLYKYPAVDAPAFAASVNKIVDHLVQS